MSRRRCARSMKTMKAMTKTDMMMTAKISGVEIAP
jgi:hypothetical protein